MHAVKLRTPETKKARSIASGLYVKLADDYGSLCGVDSVLNEQLTCGVPPTVVVV
jgi:hypothetical protein